MNEEILNILKSDPNGFTSGEWLCERLGVSRTAVWKHIEALRALGYEIEAVPHQGYRLAECPDKLIPEELQWGLKSSLIGRRILSYDVVRSTNDVAFDLAGKGLEEGTVVVSDGQTHGKGRLGRRWASPKGKGIYLSIILRPSLPPQGIAKLTLLASLSVARAVRSLTSLEPRIRWPNDILVNGKKLSGVLTEMSAEQDRLKFVIVGIGINVNSSHELLPPEATSIRLETGEKCPRVPLTQKIFEEFDRIYRDFKGGETAPWMEECRKSSSILGSYVRVEAPTPKEGYALDLDEEGALVLRLDNGFTERLFAGDVVKVR